ncbi:MAG: hypothetical protein STSR0009_09220 [Methanoregula sp.]
MIVLDTSFLINYFRGRNPVDISLKDQQVAVTAVTYHEIMVGVKRKKAKNEAMFFARFFLTVPVLEFDERSAEASSSIAAQLASFGVEVNTLDILIAGTAVSHGASQIITDDRDFIEIAKVTDLEMTVFE